MKTPAAPGEGKIQYLSPLFPLFNLPAPDSENLEKLAAHKPFIAIYLSMGHVKKVQEILETHHDKNSLCSIVHKINHPEELVLHTQIKDLVKTCDPAVVVVDKKK